jgi:hypothetical protein
MSEHPTEYQLQKALLNPHEVTPEEQSGLESHLAECSLCREHLLRLRQFYEGVKVELKSGPTERDRDTAEMILSSHRKALPSEALQRQHEAVLDAYAEVIEPYRRPLVQRIIWYARVHPVRFAGATAFGVAAVALALLFARPSKDPNPTHGRVQNQVLYVYNKDGEVLWTKPALGMEDQFNNENLAVEGGRRSITIDDIDGDGVKEVLVISYLPSRLLKASSFARDSIYCFNRGGDLRWRAGCGEMIRFGEMDFASQGFWEVLSVFFVENRKTSRPQLFALALVSPHWPMKLFELDPKSGRELQSYWNTGGLNMVLLQDLDGDGNLEIVLGGINNAYRRASIVVLDPSRVDGCGPTLPQFTPSAVGRGTEKYYALLPRTDSGELLLTSGYNLIIQLFPVGQNRLKTQTKEDTAGVAGGVLYTFGPQMQIQSVIADDIFIKRHEQLEKQGKLTKKLGPAYYQELKDSVLYWDGDRFVSTPTMNKYYLQSKQNP